MSIPILTNVRGLGMAWRSSLAGVVPQMHAENAWWQRAHVGGAMGTGKGGCISLFLAAYDLPPIPIGDN